MFEQEHFPIVTTSSLSIIARSHTLRCDAKQTENRFIEFENKLAGIDCFSLGDFLPNPLSKGLQPTYLDTQEGVPVINTLSIQNLRINVDDCNYISKKAFQLLPKDKKLKKNDVLLTMDGGTSIGKPVLFEYDGSWTVDSHVAILRPQDLSPKSLVYLLASPLGQVQFNRAESGASGQTAVTEEDLRRFIFPRNSLDYIEELTDQLDKKRNLHQQQIAEIQEKEKVAWEDFFEALIS